MADPDNDASDIATMNWRIHALALLLVGLGWLMLVGTRPQREGLNGLGDGILVVLTGFGALLYALLTTLTLWAVARRRFAAPLVHLALVCGFGVVLIGMVVVG